MLILRDTPGSGRMLGHSQSQRTRQHAEQAGVTPADGVIG